MEIKQVGDNNDAQLNILHISIYMIGVLATVAIVMFIIKIISCDRTKKRKERQWPKLRQNLTLQELRAYDGKQADGRVLLAVNGNIYDVTKGKRFFGPGGPYASYAGRDVSRNLALFSVKPSNNCEYDDLSDLTMQQMETVREWDRQFSEKYNYVGKLLRDNMQRYAETYYDAEDESNDAESDNDDIEDVGNFSTNYNFNENQLAKLIEDLERANNANNYGSHTNPTECLNM